MKHIVLVGGGNMGEALVAGLVRSASWKPSQITVTDVRSEQLARLQSTYKVRVSSDNRRAVREADVVLLAVKPQHMVHVLEELGPVIRRTQVVLSIAAGIPLRWMEKYLVKGVPVIRVMPNTPALVGAAASAMACGRWVKPSHEKLAASILKTVGTISAVSERDLDAVTAISGSGPAYVFYLAEAMKEAGRRLGLPPHVADGLVRQTVFGTGKLLAHSHEEPETLRRRVTSPGGTTEAALKVLEKAGVQSTLVRAIQQAHRRAYELSNA